MSSLIVYELTVVVTARLTNEITNTHTKKKTFNRYGHVEACTLLLARGADVSLVDRQGWSALHVSASNDTIQVAELLVAKGADAEQCTNVVGPHAHTSPSPSNDASSARGGHMPKDLAVSPEMRRLLSI